MALEWMAGRSLLKPPRLKLSVGCLCLVVVFWLISSMLAFGLARQTCVQTHQPRRPEGPGAPLTKTKAAAFMMRHDPSQRSTHAKVNGL